MQNANNGKTPDQLTAVPSFYREECVEGGGDNEGFFIQNIQVASDEENKVEEEQDLGEDYARALLYCVYRNWLTGV